MAEFDTTKTQSEYYGIRPTQGVVTPEAAYYDTLNGIMSQYHYRTRPWTLERLSEIDMEEAELYYKDRFADASDFKFIFVGNFSIDEIKPMIQTYLGNLPIKDREESWSDVGIKSPRGVIERTVYKGMEEKSRVSLNFTGPYQWNKENNHSFRSIHNKLVAHDGNV